MISQQTPAIGNFFEDFAVGQRFAHAAPRTLSVGDSSLYIALTGARQPLFSSNVLAAKLGYSGAPMDDMLVFNVAFGKTVADISANAVANLGYADVRFLAPVYPGDTLAASSEVIGLRPTSGGENGVVYVRSTACNQHEVPVLTWIRWVLVRKRDSACAAGAGVVPQMPALVAPADLPVPALTLDRHALARASGGSRWWDDYAVGERIDHPAGMTLDECDHTFATRLYQNNAKVHFDALLMQGTAHGRRLVYGGHVISVCRALAFDGLENVLTTLAINAGSHSAPTFAGDTLYCFTDVIEKLALPDRNDCGALRLRLVGIKNHPSAGFAATVEMDGRSRAHRDVVLDLDYTVLIPRAVTLHD